jgi:hypothetical protein
MARGAHECGGIMNSLQSPVRLALIGTICLFPFVLANGQAVKEPSTECNAADFLRGAKLIPVVQVLPRFKNYSEQWALRTEPNIARLDWSPPVQGGPAAPILRIPKRIGDASASFSYSVQTATMSISLKDNRMDIHGICGYGCVAIEMEDAWYLLFVETGMVDTEDMPSVAFADVFSRGKKKCSFDLILGQFVGPGTMKSGTMNAPGGSPAGHAVDHTVRHAAELFNVSLAGKEEDAFRAATNPTRSLTFSGGLCKMLSTLGFSKTQAGSETNGFPVYRKDDAFIAIAFGRIPAHRQHYALQDCSLTCVVEDFDVSVMEPVWIFWNGREAYSGYAPTASDWRTNTLWGGLKSPSGK